MPDHYTRSLKFLRFSPCNVLLPFLISTVVTTTFTDVTAVTATGITPNSNTVENFNESESDSDFHDILRLSQEHEKLGEEIKQYYNHAKDLKDPSKDINSESMNKLKANLLEKLDQTILDTKSSGIMADFDKLLTNEISNQSGSFDFSSLNDLSHSDDHKFASQSQQNAIANANRVEAVPQLFLKATNAISNLKKAVSNAHHDNEILVLQAQELNNSLVRSKSELKRAMLREKKANKDNLDLKRKDQGAINELKQKSLELSLKIKEIGGLRNEKNKQVVNIKSLQEEIAQLRSRIVQLDQEKKSIIMNQNFKLKKDLRLSDNVNVANTSDSTSDSDDHQYKFLKHNKSKVHELQQFLNKKSIDYTKLKTKNDYTVQELKKSNRIVQLLKDELKKVRSTLDVNTVTNKYSGTMNNSDSNTGRLSIKDLTAQVQNLVVQKQKALKLVEKSKKKILMLKKLFEDSQMREKQLTDQLLENEKNLHEKDTSDEQSLNRISDRQTRLVDGPVDKLKFNLPTLALDTDSDSAISDAENIDSLLIDEDSNSDIKKRYQNISLKIRQQTRLLAQAEEMLQNEENQALTQTEVTDDETVDSNDSEAEVLVQPVYYTNSGSDESEDSDSDNSDDLAKIKSDFHQNLLSKPGTATRSLKTFLTQFARKWPNTEDSINSKIFDTNYQYGPGLNFLQLGTETTSTSKLQTRHKAYKTKSKVLKKSRLSPTFFAHNNKRQLNLNLSKQQSPSKNEFLHVLKRASDLILTGNSANDRSSGDSIQMQTMSGAKTQSDSTGSSVDFQDKGLKSTFEGQQNLNDETSSAASAFTEIRNIQTNKSPLFTNQNLGFSKLDDESQSSIKNIVDQNSVLESRDRISSFEDIDLQDYAQPYAEADKQKVIENEDSDIKDIIEGNISKSSESDPDSDFISGRKQENEGQDVDAIIEKLTNSDRVSSKYADVNRILHDDSNGNKKNFQLKIPSTKLSNVTSSASDINLRISKVKNDSENDSDITEVTNNALFRLNDLTESDADTGTISKSKSDSQFSNPNAVTISESTSVQLNQKQNQQQNHNKLIDKLKVSNQVQEFTSNSSKYDDDLDNNFSLDNTIDKDNFLDINSESDHIANLESRPDDNIDFRQNLNEILDTKKFKNILHNEVTDNVLNNIDSESELSNDDSQDVDEFEAKSADSAISRSLTFFQINKLNQSELMLPKKQLQIITSHSASTANRLQAAANSNRSSQKLNSDAESNSGSSSKPEDTKFSNSTSNISSDQSSLFAKAIIEAADRFILPGL